MFQEGEQLDYKSMSKTSIWYPIFRELGFGRSGLDEFLVTAEAEDPKSSSAVGGSACGVVVTNGGFQNMTILTSWGGLSLDETNEVDAV